MKVLHVVRQFSPAVGGLEASVFSLANVQRRDLGIDASVLTLDRVFGHPEILKSVDEIEGIPVRRLPWRGSSRYPLAPKVLRHLKSADVVHVHAIDFFFDFLALTKPIHGRTMVASTHGGFFHTARQQAGKRLWFNTVTRASALAYDCIIACSQSDAELFESVAASRMRLIENGIDQSKFAGAASSTQTRTIISFGRFASHKRIDALISLVAVLRQHNPSWRLILAGRDADQTAGQLMAMAVSAGVADAVQVVSDPSDVTLRMLMRKSSYFASLSSYEGFGLAAVEAMSAGLVPILSDIPPFKRLLSAEAAGIIVSADDLAPAGEQIEVSVLSDASAYSRRRILVMETVLRYNWNDVARRYAAVYDEVSGGGRLVSMTQTAGSGA